MMTVSNVGSPSCGYSGIKGQDVSVSTSPREQENRLICEAVDQAVQKIVGKGWSHDLSREVCRYLFERFAGRLITEIIEPKLGKAFRVRVLSDDSIVIGYHKGTIVVRDSNDPQVKIAVLEGDGHNLFRFTVGPHGTVVAHYVNDQLKVFDLKKGTDPVSFQVNDSRNRTVHALDNGKLVTLSTSDDIEVWDPSSNSRKAVVFECSKVLIPQQWFPLQGGKIAVLYMNFSDPFVGCDHESAFIEVWDTDQPPTQSPLIWEIDRTLSGSAPYLLSNGSIAVQGIDGAIIAWDPDKPSTQTVMRLTGRHTPNMGSFGERSWIEVSPECIAALCKDDGIIVWDPNQLETQKPFVLKNSRGICAYELIEAPDKWMVVCACTNGKIYVWDINHLDREPISISVSSDDEDSYVCPSIGVCSHGMIAATTDTGAVRFWS